VIVLEVGQQLEHPVALFLKVLFYEMELLLELLVLHFFLVEFIQKTAKFDAEKQDVLEGFQHIGKVQEALLHDRVKVLVMQDSDFFEISGCLDLSLKLDPLALEHVHLEIGVDVVNQEAHVLSQLQEEAEGGFLVKVLHLSDLDGVDILEF
jgi:hypothetical protein